MTSTSNNISEFITEKVNKIKQEFDELAVQFTLGKAEASDRFQELKKELNDKAVEWKNTIKSNSAKSTETTKTILEHLQVQAALGKAEAKEAFDIQRKKLNQLLSKLEVELKKDKK